MATLSKLEMGPLACLQPGAVALAVAQVKPMVSSRLEPELKTRLLKAKFRGTALFRKIKSRLFSYESSGVEGNDDPVNALLRHNVADCSISTQRKQSSLQVHSEVQPGAVNTSPSHSKPNISKQPSLRYSRIEGKKSAINKEAADTCPPQKMKGDKPSDLPKFEPLSKETEFVAVENQTKNQSRSNRYDNPKTSPDVWVSGASPDSSANCLKTQQMTMGDVCFSKNVRCCSDAFSVLKRILGGAMYVYPVHHPWYLTKKLQRLEQLEVEVQVMESLEEGVVEEGS
ncbi:hypothetical protein L7F22_037749 [Adiantum nelumboides]|nr:hypothetical protein [Adiantum nelumboides]